MIFRANQIIKHTYTPMSACVFWKYYLIFDFYTVYKLQFKLTFLGPMPIL